MRVKFHGPLDRVTGSCTELHDPATNFRLLVDCGSLQGEGVAPEVNLAPFPFEPADISAVVLTHAHLDHCGRLPLLARRGFRGTIYCTRETAELARLSLRDAARFGESGFTEDDVSRLKFHEPSNAVFNRLCPIGTDLFIRFDRTGHLLGATSVMVLWGPRSRQRSIVFSGDLGPHADGEGSGHLRYRMAPAPYHYAVVESTYGNRTRAPGSHTLEARLAQLDAALTDALHTRNDLVLLPTFALGRAQEVLLDLHLLWCRHPERYRHVPVYFDAGLAQTVNTITAEAMGRMLTTPKGKVRPAWLSKDLMIHLGLDPEAADDERLLIDCLKEMLDPGHRPRQARRDGLTGWRRIHRPWPKDGARDEGRGPAVVVTGGGMCEGGPVLAWLKAHLGNPRATLLTTGFCTPETLAGRLLKMAPFGPTERDRLAPSLLEPKLGGVGPMRLTVGALHGYSAHADQAGLLHWLFEAINYPSLRGAHRTVFIQHGNAGARDALAGAIRQRAESEGESIAVELPLPGGGWFDLNRGAWDDANLSELEILRRRVATLERTAPPRPPEARAASPAP